MSINVRGMSLLGLCYKALLAVSLIFLAPAAAEEFVLTVSPERAQVIEEIVVTMGETNVIMLKFKEKHLRELSKKVKGMGSFNFLGYIFINPELKEQMPSIYSSGFKWNGFMESVRKGFDRERDAGILNDQIAGFARLVGINEEALTILVSQGDWDKLVKYLIDNVR